MSFICIVYSGALGTEANIDRPEKSNYFITPTVVPLQTSSTQFNLI